MPYNWSVDEKKLKKNKKKYAIWKIEQMVNFGLRGKKIKKETLKKYWNDIKIDPHKRQFLKMIIYDKNTHGKST